jgi:MtN3 and saliva related transmembrane protein
MDSYINIIGTCAACLTTSALLPQVIRTIKTNDTSSLSLLFALAINTGTMLWLIYGILLGNPIITLSNAIVLILSGIIVFYKTRNIVSKQEKL